MDDELIAGAIITFDRGHYLKRLLESLHNAHDSQNIDWYVFIDGDYVKQRNEQLDTHTSQDEMESIVENHKLYVSHIVKQPYNKDIVEQKNDACDLFDGYDYVMFFEDDLVVGADYLVNLYRANKQFPQHVPSMYWHENTGDLHELQTFEGARLWGYSMTDQLWQDIRDDWNNYVEWMSETTYRKRIGNPNRDKIEGMIDANSLSHDVVISNLIYKHGEGKIKPAKTRGRYIGKDGHHAYKLDHMWEKKEMHQQPDKIEYNNDPVESFRLIS